jgi:imidazolonepropionase-like amidohydrolase
MKTLSSFALVLLLALFAAAQEAPKQKEVSEKPAPQQAPPPKITYIKAGRLFDSTGEQLKTNMVIVVEGERIKQVALAAEVRIPQGAEVIDLSNTTVLPGLIDLHTHLSSRADRYAEIWDFKDTPFNSAFNAVKNAETTLMAGFTTVQDVGSVPFVMVDLRNSVNSGYLPGPRVVAAGPGISITGGHGDMNNFSPYARSGSNMFPEQRGFGIADGVDQARQTVRAQLKHDVDVIKIIATGGVLSKGDQPGAPQYTVEELKAAADEAHEAGRRITAHAHGAEGIKRAIAAGIDSIQHCSLVDDEGIKMALEKGTMFVMDIYNDDYLVGEAIKFGLPEENVEKEKLVGRLQRENFQKAFKAGVKMGFGTDAGVYPHGDNAKQFFYMVKYGMTPAQAILAATRNSADSINNRLKGVGQIIPGNYADIIAVAGNPLDDIRQMEKVQFVMKGGRVYRMPNPQPSAGSGRQRN